MTDVIEVMARAIDPWAFDHDFNLSNQDYRQINACSFAKAALQALSAAGYAVVPWGLVVRNHYNIAIDFYRPPTPEDLKELSTFTLLWTNKRCAEITGKKIKARIGNVKAFHIEKVTR